jgi:hypothetical protein
MHPYIAGDPEFASKSEVGFFHIHGVMIDKRVFLSI